MKYLVLFLIIGTYAFAHEGHHHGSHTHEAKDHSQPAVRGLYDQIQANYLKSVKPIFDQKCAACHSLNSPAPWYVQIPGIGYIVESDRTEAKEHLEISKGFPFAGHGTNDEDLDAIEKSMNKSEMPPTLYKAFHPTSKITEQEKIVILDWIKNSKNTLQPTNPSGE